MILVIFLLVVNPSQATDQDPHKKIFTVTIDAGHGGHTPGAVGKKSKEKDLTLAIALKLGSYIESRMEDVKVVYTRKTDLYLPLDERANIANRNNSDLFISIHVDGSKSPRPMGTSSYVMGYSKSSQNFELVQQENKEIFLEEDYETKYEGFDPNSAESYIMFSLFQNANLGQSLSFATLVQDQFRTFGQRGDRGVYQDVFMVLWRTTMPSVLIETGFISNPTEEAFLLSENGQELIATSIFNAFAKYKSDWAATGQADSRVAAQAIPDTPKEAQKPDSLKSEKVLPPPAKDTMHVKIGIQPAKKDTQPTVKDNQLTKRLEIPEKRTVNEPAQTLSDIEFRVQVMASQKKLTQSSPEFKGQKGFTELFVDGYYKYVTEPVKTHSEALEIRKRLAPLFKGAFIVAYKDGKRIPIEEALQGVK